MRHFTMHRKASPLSLQVLPACARSLPLLLLLVASFGIFLDQARAQSPAPFVKLQRQYEQESDPVHKARLLVKLGAFELDRAAAFLKDGDEREALSGLQYYRDEVRRTSDLLTDSGLDPARRPAGFKELQIALRENIRRLGDMIFLLPPDDRAAFEDVRAGLAATQEVLFEELFPTPNDVARKKR